MLHLLLWARLPRVVLRYNLTGQIAEGCSEVAVENLQEMVKMSIDSFQDDFHPRVAYAAINAIGQFQDYLPNIQVHQLASPALYLALDNKNPRVQGAAMHVILQDNGEESDGEDNGKENDGKASKNDYAPCLSIRRLLAVLPRLKRLKEIWMEMMMGVTGSKATSLLRERATILRNCRPAFIRFRDTEPDFGNLAILFIVNCMWELILAKELLKSRYLPNHVFLVNAFGRRDNVYLKTDETRDLEDKLMTWGVAVFWVDKRLADQAAIRAVPPNG